MNLDNDGRYVHFRHICGDTIMFRDGDTLEAINAASAAHQCEVYWSLMEGDNHDPLAATPEAAGITVPLSVLHWADRAAREAGRRGYGPEEPGLYLLVGFASELGGLENEIGGRPGLLSAEDAKLLRDEFQRMDELESGRSR